MNEISNIISQLEQQRAAIERALAALREVSGQGTVAAKSAPATRKRRLSPEGRRRIAEATRRRWAAKRAADAAANKPAKKKTAKKSSAATS